MRSIAKYSEQEYGLSNPMCSISMPKIQRNEISVLNESERKNLQNHLVNNLNNTNIGILLTMYSGMRIGEICALKWSDIDLQSGIIRISKTVQRINDKIGSSKTKIIVGSPKAGHQSGKFQYQTFL